MNKVLSFAIVAGFAVAPPIWARQDDTLRDYALYALHIRTYAWAQYDLDGDGRPEQFLYATDPEWCGSGGCTLFVLKKQRTGYRVIMHSTITRLPIGVLKATAHGWHDIAVEIGDGGTPAHMVRIRFNGARYPGNPSLAPAVPSGKVRLLIVDRPPDPS